jgi:nucleoside-diphosphate-sugar epimerase
MTKVFLTGATGVLGRRVVPLLTAAGSEVTAVVRTPDKAALVRAQGATPAEVDLFDAESVAAAVAGHDAIVHLATNIPTGAAAATRRGWRINDRLRSEAAVNLSRAAFASGIGRYVQESITFPYVDGGDAWIDERRERDYFWGNRTTIDAEAAAVAITDHGGAGVVLRFAMFMAIDSAHMRTFAAMARRGIWGVFGDDDAYISFVDIDDAAAAVVAAIDAPAGVYNVAEPDPVTRGTHRAALAAAVGRDRLRGVPGFVETLGGAGAESLARSHRVSSASLQAVTQWRPATHVVDDWTRL